jgi:hypothetical protein
VVAAFVVAVFADGHTRLWPVREYIGISQCSGDCRGEALTLRGFIHAKAILRLADSENDVEHGNIGFFIHILIDELVINVTLSARWLVCCPVFNERDDKRGVLCWLGFRVELGALPAGRLLMRSDLCNRLSSAVIVSRLKKACKQVIHNEWFGIDFGELSTVYLARSAAFLSCRPCNGDATLLR